MRPAVDDARHLISPLVDTGGAEFVEFIKSLAYFHVCFCFLSKRGLWFVWFDVLLVLANVREKNSVVLRLSPFLLRHRILRRNVKVYLYSVMR